MNDIDLTLANCAAEPIHIPGSIQPHGALFAFSAQRLLVAWSANCADADRRAAGRWAPNWRP